MEKKTLVKTFFPSFFHFLFSDGCGISPNLVFMLLHGMNVCDYSCILYIIYCIRIDVHNTILCRHIFANM